MDYITRDQAIAIVGQAAVTKVDDKTCELSGRIMDDRDVLEFTASLCVTNDNDDDCTITAYYYQDREAVNDCESLDALTWDVTGYRIL